ncbi:hypothetical protein [Aquitalea magnusonii]|uniref:Uncharacterized protein n=1 Tax=Aquitalea magnusonii TaxID=332411 RepID=A0A318IWX1_9NEIS|nr:hypothetical protein [Aquitalea magnusonii]PXX38861.1 hypothetical protein DFR38_1319 [Aquitalea magnusonii]
MASTGTAEHQTCFFCEVTIYESFCIGGIHSRIESNPPKVGLIVVQQADCYAAGSEPSA